MNRLLAAVCATVIAGVSDAHAQALTPLNGTVLTGAAPTGFASQPFEYFCTAAQALCWPQFQLWDGTTRATVNSGDSGLTTHVANNVGVTGTFWQATQPVSLASLPALTAGAAAIGSITNTTFGATLNATPSLANGNGVVATQGGTVLSATNGSFANILQGNAVLSLTNGLFVAPTTAATWAITAASLPLPTGAATAALQTNGSQKTQIVDGSGNVIASTSNNLDVQCANCSGSGVSTGDEAPFTAGSSLFAGSGGFFQTTATSNPLTTGQQGLFQVTANRALFSNLRNASGAEIGTSTTPLSVTLANTGANATAMLVTGAGGTFPATQSGAWNITNVSGTVSLPTGAATAALQSTPASAGSTSAGQTGNLAMGFATTGSPTDTTGDSYPISLDTAGNMRTVDKSDVAQGSTTSGQVGTLMQGAVTTVAPTYTTAQTSPLSLDTAGNLRVNVVTGGGSGGTSSADASTWTGGTTSMTQIGCEFTTGGATAISTAHAGTVGCTAARGVFTDLSSEAGTAITSTPSAYGTAPTGNVIGANVFVTNTNANGSAVSASSSPVVIASDQAAVATKAASAAFVAGSIADLAHGQGTMAASVPVAIASNQSSIPVTVASGGIASGGVASGAVASGAFAPGSIGSGAIAAGASAGDPCMFGTKINLPISTAATALTQIIAASGSTKIYICSIMLVAPAATAFNLNTGTGTNCGTSTAALIGSLTPGNGMSFAANGGVTLGNGSGTIVVTAASSELCTLQSNAVQIAGNLTYVQQ